jgi:4-diphosphocytidyl-2-C-methyl-D-erythritol kinase
VGVSTPAAFARWDRRMAQNVGSVADAGLAALGRTAEAAVPTQTSGAKLTMPEASDRMSELGRGLSAWLSERYSGAPFRRGRAENPLLELVRAGIKNDFEQVVFPEYPELSEGKSALERAGAKYASLSGSGSTLYGLFASKQAARAAVARLRKQGWAAQATVTLRRDQYWRRVF